MQFWINLKMNLAIQKKLWGGEDVESKYNFSIGYDEAYIDTKDNEITFMTPCGPHTRKLPDDLIFVLEEDGTVTLRKSLFGTYGKL